MPNPNDILAKYGVTPPAPSPSDILAKYGVNAPGVANPATTSVAAAEDSGPQLVSPDSVKQVSPAEASKLSAQFEPGYQAKQAALLPLGEREQQRADYAMRRNLGTQAIRRWSDYTPLGAILKATTGFDSKQVFDKTQGALPSTAPYASAGGVRNFLIDQGVSAMDPLTTGLAAGAGSAVTKAPIAAKVFDSAAEMQTARAAAAYEYRAYGDTALAAYKQAQTSYILNRLSRYAIKGAAEGGAFTAASELGAQSDEGKFSPIDLAASTLKGMGMGGALGLLGGTFAREGAENFAAGRKAVVQGRLQDLQAASEKPRIATSLDLQQSALQDQAADIKSKLADHEATLNAEEKAGLQDQLNQVNTKIAAVKANVTAGIDKVSQRAALLNDRLDDLAEQHAEHQAVVDRYDAADPNRLTPLGPKDQATRDAAATRAAAVRSKIESVNAQLNVFSDEANLRWNVANRATGNALKKTAEGDIIGRTRFGGLQLNDLAKKFDSLPVSQEAIDDAIRNGQFPKGTKQPVSIDEMLQQSPIEVPTASPGQRPIYDGYDHPLNADFSMSDHLDAAQAQRNLREALPLDHPDRARRLVEEVKHLKRWAALTGQDATTFMPEEYMNALEGKPTTPLDYQLALDKKNSRLEELLQKQEQLQRGVGSPFFSADAKLQALKDAHDLVNQRLSDTMSSKQDLLTSYKNLVQQSGPLSLKNELKNGWTTGQEYLNRSIDLANSEVQKLVDRGVLKPEQKSAFATQLTQDLLAAKKLNIANAAPALPQNKIIRGMMQKIELMNFADKKKFTETVDSLYDTVRAKTSLEHEQTNQAASGHKLISALEKKGLSAEVDQPNFLRYVESDDAGNVFFNPNAVQSKALTRPVYEGNVPADQVLLQFPELGQLRQEYDRMYGRATESGRADIGYAPGYVNIMGKKGIAPFGTTPSPSAIGTPSQYLERNGGLWDSAAHETNMYRLWQSYVNGIERDRAFTPLLPKIHAEMQKLLTLGDGDAASAYGDAIGHAMGFQKKTDLAGAFAREIQFANEPAIRAMIRAAGEQDPSISDDIFKLLRQAQYESMVLKPKTTILRAIQPGMVGSAEIGPYNVARGYALLKDPEMRAFAKSFDHELLGTTPGVVDDLGLSGIQRPASKAIAKVIDLPTTLTGLRQSHDVLERIDRRVIFLGGYDQFKRAATQGGEAVDRVLDGLLEGERAAVLKSYRAGGAEAAAQTYGVIRSYRTNAIFSTVNKPDFLKEGIGQLVPFTSWGTNQLARLVTDTTRVGSGSAKQLATRIALPMAAIAAFKGLTGYTIPNAHPAGDVERSLNFELFPAITHPAETYSKYGAGAALKDAAGFLPGYAQYSDYKKRLARSNNPLAAAAGLEPVSGPPLQRALSTAMKPSKR